jgi:hypothetical protein
MPWHKKAICCGCNYNVYFASSTVNRVLHLPSKTRSLYLHHYELVHGYAVSEVVNKFKLRSIASFPAS